VTDTHRRRLLPEWAEQDGVLLVWPHAGTDWAADLPAVEDVCLDLARAITPRERLLVVCHDGPHQVRISRRLKAAGIDQRRIRYAIAPSDDTWARDFGPLTVHEAGQPRLLDFRFNGWGEKYPHARDDAITATLHAEGVFDEVPLERIDLVLEGGAIDTDGEGTLLTTVSCLLDARRNPGLDQAALTERLNRYLGVERIHWLTHGWLDGDDTDGHVDMLVRFCDPGTLAVTVCDDPNDRHYRELRALRDEVAALRDTQGRPYRLLELPIPAPIFDRGRRLPASYANFLIINEAVLVPLYADPHDAMAMATLSGAFTDREIIGIDCRPLIRQNGSLHCLTMQLPAGTLP